MRKMKKELEEAKCVFERLISLNRVSSDELPLLAAIYDPGSGRVLALEKDKRNASF